MNDQRALYFPRAALRLAPDVPGARAWGVALDKTMLTYFEVEPHSRFATQAIRGPRLRTQFVLESQAFGTHLTLDVTGDVPGGRLGAVLAEGFLRSELTKSLQRLKDLCEREAGTAAKAEPAAGGDPACWLHLEEPGAD